VFVDGVRERRAGYPLNRAKQSTAGNRVLQRIIPVFVDFVTRSAW
jgi:hypothetical protein